VKNQQNYIMPKQTRSGARSHGTGTSALTISGYDAAPKADAMVCSPVVASPFARNKHSALFRVEVIL